MLLCCMIATLQTAYAQFKQAPIQFDIVAKDGTHMMLKLEQLSQLDSIPNLDSLLFKVGRNLQPLKDSLNQPYVNWKVEYNDFVKAGMYNITITPYRSASSSYRYRDNTLTKLKSGSDTLVITRYTTSQDKAHVARTDKDSVFKHFRSYTITLGLSNIGDIAGLSPGMLDAALAEFKAALPDKVKHLNQYTPLNATYYASNRWLNIYPGDDHFAKSHSFDGYGDFGISYTRGSWTPSAGIGAQYWYTSKTGDRNAFMLYWEPYFFFSRSAANALIADRNDFVTLKFSQAQKQNNSKGYFYAMMSVSYLVRREGDWYDPTTFKLAFTGYRVQNVADAGIGLSLNPEFTFSKFFKRFSPTLKLTLLFE